MTSISARGYLKGRGYTSYADAPWTRAKIARDMRVGERGNIYFEAVDWQRRTVDLNGSVYGKGVRTPTCAIWRVNDNTWLVVRSDLEQMIYRERPADAP